MQVDYLVLGLGNPNEKYKGTRHNAGADFIEYFASEQGIEFKKEKLALAKLAFLQVGGKIVALAILDSYMNESGEALRKLMDFLDFKDAENMLVVYDDVDLNFGDFKFSFGKSCGGHNGVRSIIENIKTRDFYRLRVGIGPQKGGARASFVLKSFSLLERAKMRNIFYSLSQALLVFLQKGASKAMNRFN